MTMLPDIWQALVIVLAGVGVLLAAYVLHKVRRVHLMSYEILNKIPDSIRRTSFDLWKQTEALEALYRELGLEKGLPPTRGWAASPDFLLLIARHAREARPNVVVECGAGTSTVVLARCMQLNGVGRVYSLEHQPDFSESVRANLARHGLEEWATVIDAPLRPCELGDKSWLWYAEDKLLDGQIDLLVVDGPSEEIGPLARYPAGPLLFPRLRAGAMVFLDDAARDSEKEIIKRWTREFPSLELRDHDCEKGAVSLLEKPSPGFPR